MAKKKEQVRYSVVAGDAEMGRYYIQILRGTKDVLVWHSWEWEEDPRLVVGIVEAVVTALEDPERMDIRLERMGILK